MEDTHYNQKYSDVFAYHVKTFSCCFNIHWYFQQNSKDDKDNFCDTSGFSDFSTQE